MIVEKHGFVMPIAEPMIIGHPREIELVVYTPGHKGSGNDNHVIVDSMLGGTVMIGYSPRMRSTLGEPGATVWVRYFREEPSEQEVLRIAKNEWCFGVPKNV